MKGLESWALGYAVNALWQVPLIFAAGWLAARLVRRAGSRTEHRVWVTVLLLETVLPATRLRVAEMTRTVLELMTLSWHGPTAIGEVRVAVSAGSVSGGEMLHLPGWLLLGLLSLYGCSLAYFAGRLGWGIWKTVVMRREALRVSLTGDAEAVWQRCLRAFEVRRPELAVSAVASGPVTVGLLHGVLLVPMGFLERVSEADLATVVAHEFAHMQRGDFLKNLLYEMILLPVAFHPVVWLTRLRLAESREMVCDRMAADATAGQERYARSLLRLASLMVQGTPARTLHAIGIFDANLFERRIMNLTETRVEVRGVRRLVMVTACAMVGLATCGSALALRMEITAPVSQDAASTQGPMKVAGGVMAGNNLTKVTPVYPKDAKAAKIQGAVVLHAVIGKNGVVENLQVVSGPKELQTSALDAVRQWIYKPFLLNGEPTVVDTTVTVNYSLSK